MIRLMIEAQVARFMDPYGGMDHRVFTNCNVCGITLRTRDEDEVGMCERCAAE
jgi:hypothetical protein